MDVGTLVTRAAHPVRRPRRRRGTRRRPVHVRRARRPRRPGSANGLLALGLEPGDRVLDLQTNSTAYVETDLAIRAGRPGPRRPQLPAAPDRLGADRGRLRGAGARRTDEPLRGRRPPTCGSTWMWSCVSDGPGTPYESIVGGQTRAAAGPLGPDALCGLHYSSGTTGHPKGARRTHRNWFASVVNMTHDVLGGVPVPDDCYVHAGPITHTSPVCSCCRSWSPALARSCCPRWDPETFIEAVTSAGRHPHRRGADDDRAAARARTASAAKPLPG